MYCQLYVEHKKAEQDKYRSRSPTSRRTDKKPVGMTNPRAN